MHWTLETLRWHGGHPRCHCVPRPKVAAWLKLIEGVWKSLGQRALAGRDGRSPDEVERAVHAGVDEWNQQPTPFLWGRPPTPRRQLKRTYVYRI